MLLYCSRWRMEVQLVSEPPTHTHTYRAASEVTAGQVTADQVTALTSCLAVTLLT